MTRADHYVTRDEVYSVAFARGVITTLCALAVLTGLALALFGPTAGAWLWVPAVLVAGPGALLARIAYVTREDRS